MAQSATWGWGIGPKRLDGFLFIVIPGIGGSVLERRTRSGRREMVWGGARELVRRVISPAVLEVGDDDGIIATGAISDWQIGPLSYVRGYGELIRSVASLVPEARIDHGDPDHPDLEARVVAFPFDFRRSVEEAARELARSVYSRLDHLGWSDGEQRVVVVAHSMGGLVARSWVGVNGGHRVCRGIVTLGTPHRGAPKALDVAANGLPLGPLRVAPRLSKLLRRWPGFYELLPRYPMIAVPGLNELQYPKDLDVDWLDPARASRAWRVHRDIEDGWAALNPRLAPGVVPVFGCATQTLEMAAVRPDGSLRSSKARPDGMGNAEWFGDKTVPSVSAVPIELDTLQGKSSHRPQPGVKHGELVKWAGLASEITYLCTGLTTHVRGPGDRSIVVDSEELWPVGQPPAMRCSGVRTYQRGPPGAH